jgi:hypothetical protein
MKPSVEAVIAEAHQAVVQGQHPHAAALLNQALKRVVEEGGGEGEQAQAIREDLDTLQEMAEVSAYRKEMGLTRLPGEPATPDEDSQ